MANYEVAVPKLGESVIEATITKWLKNEGEMVTEDDPIVEIATDKVDTELPSPVSGKLLKKLFREGDVVPIGAVYAVLDAAVEATRPPRTGKAANEAQAVVSSVEPVSSSLPVTPSPEIEPPVHEQPESVTPSGTRFYSPLVRSIARQENISIPELDGIAGTGKDDRLTKQDVMNYLKFRGQAVPEPVEQVLPGEDRIVEMDRIRQLISAHMVRSVQTSPHVTSFQEADMTSIVRWREKNKDPFLQRENEKLTFTPVFIEAIARAVRDFPQVNVSVDGTKIIMHRNVNIGMAVSLPNFNLIVPVIRNAHEKSLLGIVKAVNDLSKRARAGKLVPDEISGGTISLTNLGSFGNIMGTPIINQPQTAIVAVGAIKKRVVVIEAPGGDTIAIRPIMIVSVTYDHRVIDGALGGQFLGSIVKYLESFDPNQPI